MASLPRGRTSRDTASQNALAFYAARRMADPSPENASNTNNSVLVTGGTSSRAAPIPASESVFVSASVSSPAPNSRSSAPSRRLKPRPVIYKSTNLALAAPDLVASTAPQHVSAVRSIQNASETAERVRNSFRSRKQTGQQLGEAIVGSDDESNAKKYERRLKMNRESAAASRVRREAYTKALEAELVNMELNYKKLLDLLTSEREKSRVLYESVVAESESNYDQRSGNVLQPPAASSSATDAPATDTPIVTELVDDEVANAVPKSTFEDMSIPANAPTDTPTSPVEESSNNAPKDEDYQLLEDSLFAVQMQLSPEIQMSLDAPLHPPLPECFLNLSEDPSNDGQSHFFDSTGL